MPRYRPLPDERLTLRFEKMFRPYLRHGKVVVKWRRGKWHYPEKLPAWALGRMIRGDLWLAPRAHPFRSIRYLSIDIDRVGTEYVGAGDARVLRVRRALQHEHPPLVVRTPGGGVRLYFRVPESDLRHLITGPAEGPVAKLLVSEGQSVGPGIVEIFPQLGLGDRLPLGRDMPILDAASFRVVCESPSHGGYSDEAFAAALERLDVWNAREDRGLLRMLRRHVSAATVPVAAHIVVQKPRHPVTALPSVTDIAQIRDQGLTRRASRYGVGWIVACDIVKHPDRYEETADADPSTPEGLARALARWLAANANGMSDEWTQVLQREGSVDRAMSAWERRYLETGPKGSFVDRVLNAAKSGTGKLLPIRHIGKFDWHWILDMSVRNAPPGPGREKLEVWTAACLRAIRNVVCYRRSRSPVSRRRYEEFERDGEQLVRLELCSNWMRRWPYGKGADSGQYRAFLRILVAERVLRQVRQHYMPLHEGALRVGGRAIAAMYETRIPGRVWQHELFATPQRLGRALALCELRRRRMTIDQAYHTLWAALVRGDDLVAVYGRHVGARIRADAAEIRYALRRVAAADRTG